MSYKQILSGLIIGASIGYAVNKIKQPDYVLREKNNILEVQSRRLDKSYEIIRTNNTFYLGDFEHNLQGVREIAYRNGLEFKEQYVLQEQSKRKELELIVQEQNTKIRRRKFFDKLDETADKIKFWYQDLKRRQLDWI